MITHPKSSPIETVCQLLPPSSQFYQRPQCTHFYSCFLSYPLLFLFSKLTHLAKSGKVCFCCLHQMTLIDTAPKTNCKLYPRKSINCSQLPKSQFSRLENVEIQQAPLIFHGGPGAGPCVYFHSMHFHTAFSQALMGSLFTAISWGSHGISQAPETEPFNYYLIEETL